MCVSSCFNTTNNYANNATKVCGPSINCQANHFGRNSSLLCVQSCPNGSFSYQSALVKLCVDKCAK